MNVSKNQVQWFIVGPVFTGGSKDVIFELYGTLPISWPSFMDRKFP